MDKTHPQVNSIAADSQTSVRSPIAPTAHPRAGSRKWLRADSEGGAAAQSAFISAKYSHTRLKPWSLGRPCKGTQAVIPTMQASTTHSCQLSSGTLHAGKICHSMQQPKSADSCLPCSILYRRCSLQRRVQTVLLGCSLHRKNAS